MNFAVVLDEGSLFQQPAQYREIILGMAFAAETWSQPAQKDHSVKTERSIPLLIPPTWLPVLNDRLT